MTKDEIKTVDNAEPADTYTETEQDSRNRAADHTVTAGDWEGATWTYDSSKRILTLDNGVELYLQRETDWEASPRTHTIVYAGYGDDYKTYWGKKSK